ncbi:MAG: hypothetical protein FK731_02170 [Asgard group archaeon]|nr:hypothetical protein [Asgard group archaeon]
MKQKVRNLIIGMIGFFLVANYLGLAIINIHNIDAIDDNLFVNYLGRVDISVGYKIRLDNDRAYVSSNEGIDIIDIQNPLAPSHIGLIEGTMGFDVKDNIVFTTDSNGLVVIDASNTNDPQIIGTSNTGQWAYNTRVNNTLVFSIVSGDLDIYDISDLNNPIRIGQYTDTGRGNDIIVYGDIAYYADPDEGLEIINVTNPTNPEKIRTISNTIGAWDLYISNELLFLGCHGLGFKVLDITNPTNPSIIKQFNDGGEVYGVCGNETFIFLGDLQEGVEVLNNTSTYLSEVASYVATPHDIEFNGNYIYLADQDNGFLLLELSNTQNEITNGLNLHFGFIVFPLIGVIIGIQCNQKRKTRRFNTT